MDHGMQSKSFRYASDRPHCIDVEHIENTIRELSAEHPFAYFFKTGFMFQMDCVQIHADSAIGHCKEGRTRQVFVEVLDTDNTKHFLPVAVAAMQLKAKAYPLFWRIGDGQPGHYQSFEQQLEEIRLYPTSELS